METYVFFSNEGCPRNSWPVIRLTNLAGQQEARGVFKKLDFFFRGGASVSMISNGNYRLIN